MFNGDGLYEYDRETRKYTFPDVLDFKTEPYATVIPHRSGSAFKVHKTEGLANGALSHHKEGAKYKQENGKWVKVWEFREPTECDNCHQPLVAERDKSKDYYGHDKYWLRSPLHKGSHIFAPFLCRRCYNAEEEVRQDRLRAKQWQREQKNKN